MKVFYSLLATLLFVSVGCATQYSEGLPNFSMISGNIARSGAPTGDGCQQLINKFPGRRIHVIELNFPEEVKNDCTRAAGFDVHSLGIEPRTDPKNPWNAVLEVVREPDSVVWKKIADLINSIPVNDDGLDLWLIHCYNGHDRTGLVSGWILVTKFHWTKDAAWQYMIDYGYHWELIGLDRKWNELK